MDELIYHVLLTLFLTILIAFLFNQLTMGMCNIETSLAGKVAIVTGGNAGIGLETARGLAERGARVIIGCRSKQKGVAAVQDIMKTTGSNHVEFKLLDLLSLESVKKFAEDIVQREKEIHILVNNAGMNHSSENKKLPREVNLSADGLERVTQTNHLAPFLLTLSILPSLSAGRARIVNVSSLMNIFGKLDIENINSEKQYDGGSSYSKSKLMNIIFTREVSRRWKHLGITSFSLHPGFVRSNIFDNSSLKHLFIFLSYLFGKNIVQGAQTSIFLSSASGIESLSGEHFSDCRRDSYLVHPQAKDEGFAKLFWEKSQKLVGLA